MGENNSTADRRAGTSRELSHHTGISEARQWQDSGNAANTGKLKEQKRLGKHNSSLLECPKSKHK